KHGLACDNLVSAQLVTASGGLVAANADGDDELLWGLRGGGGNFGVVTSFEYELHPVGPIVYGGLLAYPRERGAEVLAAYREVVATGPADLGLNCLLLTPPPL